MLAEMAQPHYDLVQGSFVILVKFRKQDLVLVKESGAEARVRLQHNLNMCKNRIKKSKLQKGLEQLQCNETFERFAINGMIGVEMCRCLNCRFLLLRI